MRQSGIGVGEEDASDEFRMLGASVIFQMCVLREKIDDQEKKDARDEVNAQRMDMTGAFAFDELVR